MNEPTKIGYTQICPKCNEPQQLSKEECKECGTKFSKTSTPEDNL